MKKSHHISKKHNTNLKFRWPLKKVMSYCRDGKKGVKSIGIVITGRPGSSVVTAATGIVTKIGYMRGFGKYIVISHADRYVTVYANLHKISVREGERIAKGIPIGSLNDSERRLHFQIGYAGKPKDPIKFLPGKGRM